MIPSPPQSDRRRADAAEPRMRSIQSFKIVTLTKAGPVEGVLVLTLYGPTDGVAAADERLTAHLKAAPGFEVIQPPGLFAKVRSVDRE